MCAEGRHSARLLVESPSAHEKRKGVRDERFVPAGSGRLAEVGVAFRSVMPVAFFLAVPLGTLTNTSQLRAAALIYRTRRGMGNTSAQD